jgi:hypothetical protein
VLVELVCAPPLLLTTTPGATSELTVVGPVVVLPVVPCACWELVETLALDSDPDSDVELEADSVDAVAESDDAAELVDDSEPGAPVSAAANPYPVVTAATSQAATASPPYPPIWVTLLFACVPGELAGGQLAGPW